MFLVPLLLFYILPHTTNAASLSVELPAVGGAEPGQSPASFINYIVIFSFVAVGALALFALLAGGFRYLTAAGRPAAESDAKDRIRSALLGLVFVLAAIALLYTINPDLVRLRNPGIPILALPRAVIQQPVLPGSCELLRASWDNTQSCHNETTRRFDRINMVVEGRNCDGWGVSLNVLDEGGATMNEPVPAVTFDSSNVVREPWQPEEPGKYTFRAVAGSGSTLTQQASGQLLATDGLCISTKPSEKNCGDPNVVCSQTTCPALDTVEWCNLIPEVIAGLPPISSDINSRKFLEAIMRIESGGVVNKKSPSGACGLMQFLPETANKYAARCGITHEVTCDWLRGLDLRPGETIEAVARASICMADLYAWSIRNGRCYGVGQTRDVAAGYNGGEACGPGETLGQSTDCVDLDCSNRNTRAYECLWDDPQHTTCNTGFNETRNYVARFNKCYFNTRPPCQPASF